MSFDSLGLSAELLRAIKAQKYNEPTTIQQRAIPVVLEGRDLKAEAQTGTGKTAAFTLPVLELLSRNTPPKRRKIRALILAPTRELAAQVGESIETYGRYLDIKSTVIFGGVGIYPQTKRLARGVDVVVATPGRLLDHLGQKTIDLRHVEFFVLDEADRMLDMGFIRDIRKVIAALPDRKNRQSLMFSATFSKEMRNLADSLLHDPEHVAIGVKNATADKVKQKVHFVPKAAKRDALVDLIKEGDWHQVLVFTRTKYGADRLARHLDRNGISATAIHGRKTQGARTKSLAAFKRGKVQVLVATDIASRGIDIDQLPYVVNFELPNVPEDYVHRIGRTARAGNSGLAVSLVDAEERPLLTAIEGVIKRNLSGESGAKAKHTKRKPASRKKHPQGAHKRSAKKRRSNQSRQRNQSADAAARPKRKKTARKMSKKSGQRKRFAKRSRSAAAVSPAIA